MSGSVIIWRLIAVIVISLSKIEIVPIGQLVQTVLRSRRIGILSFLGNYEGASLDFRNLHFLLENLYHCRDTNDALEEYSRKYHIDIILAQYPSIANGCVTGFHSDWPSFYSTNFSASILLTNKNDV